MDIIIDFLKNNTELIIRLFVVILLGILLIVLYILKNRRNNKTKIT